MPLSSAQKAAVASFVSVTGATDKAAQRVSGLFFISQPCWHISLSFNIHMYLFGHVRHSDANIVPLAMT